MRKFGKIAPLINSERYNKVIQEISDAIDSSIQSIPFVEPQLCAFIEDAVARQLLDKETEANQEIFSDVFQIYQEIIEDVLFALLELGPLEDRKAEMLKTFSNSTFSKLLERYEISEREEAALIAKYRDQINSDIDSTMTLQNAVYEIEGSNRRLRKDLKTLDLQLKRTRKELEQERAIVVDEIEDYEEQIRQAESMEGQLQEVNEQIQKGEDLKEQLENECVSIQQEIDSLMEQLVAMNKRSVRNSRKNRK